MALSRDPAALTDGEGRLLIANTAYRERFGGAPAAAGAGATTRRSNGLELVKSMAWRDGGGCVAGIATASGPAAVEVERVGSRGDLLLWRFPELAAPDPMMVAAKRLAGPIGERLASAGLLAALVDEDGMLIAANRSFASARSASSRRPRSCVSPTSSNSARTARCACWLKVSLPARCDWSISRSIRARTAAPAPFCWSTPPEGSLDSRRTPGAARNPADRPCLGRSRWPLPDHEPRVPDAGGIKGAAMPFYPGDLVVKEDKAPVADAVRRNARGPAMSGDLAVRLARQNAEPVALTVAGLRGLGDAAVLLLLKDNSEEAKLKRQIAQATKMQVVGQLAGGVAHDFNNILTAIIGHCDLMLMRHTPGDSDYDDIQQIKSNSNRAAGLTRQLLAFSRQQTLRPQVLQLPDVVSEVSHLLKRLLGETVKLVVKHGRDLGPVRADPGQLEQVIVNLAVNARDAMAPKGGGTLTIQTYAVRADQVAELGSEILPVADYSALSVTDTGSGIAAKRARQGVRAVLHDQGNRQGHRARPVDGLRHRQAVGRLHLRRFEGRRRHPLRHLPAGPPRGSQRRQAAQAGQAQGTRAVGHRHRPAGRGRADGPRRRRARADPPRLYRDYRRQWRGGARGARQGRTRSCF